MKYASIPLPVVQRAVRKARIEYVRGAVLAGQDPGPEDECWAEFEALADYASQPSEPTWLTEYREQGRNRRAASRE